MNKKAVIKANLIYILIVVAFIATMSLFVWDQMNGASVWAEYFSKETTRIINTAVPGETVTLDIHKATEVARKNQVNRFEEIFEFDNANSRVCVKLSPGRKSCYYYFNNVDIIEPELILGRPINMLKFTIKEKQKRTNNE